MPFAHPSFLRMKTLMRTTCRNVGAIVALVLPAALWSCGPVRESPAAGGSASAFEPVKIEAPGAGTAYYKVGNFYLAGQPAESGFADAKGRGIRTVINLRPPSEQKGFDEKKVVESLGLSYVSIPVTPQDLDDEKVEQFIAALKAAEKPVLVHCASGGRVSALWAAHLGRSYGVSPEEAVALAARSGLRNEEMKKFVKDHLERHRAPAPAGAAAPVK